MMEKLPKGWKWVKLSEITNNFDGKRKPLSRVVRSSRKGEFRYFGATEIVDYIDDYIFDGEYLLIGEDGANLLSKNKDLAFIVKGKFWVNNHAHVLSAKEVTTNEFIYYYFNSLNIAQFVTGTAQPKLNQANLNKIPVALPPLKTQELIVSKIEELFSELDKGVEDLKKAQQQLKTYRQSVLKWAFEGRLTNENVEDGVLPKGWELVKMNDIITLSSLKHSPTSIDNIFYIGLEHIEKHTGKLTSKVGIEKISTIKNKFSIGDILYGKLRPNLNKVYLSKEEGVCSTDILVLKLSKECLGKYLHPIMLSSTFVNEMSENTSGVNLPRVSTKFIMNYEIPLPPIEEQQKIVQEIESRFSVADKLEENIKESLQQAEVLRQSILKKAFSGELVES